MAEGVDGKKLSYVARVIAQFWKALTHAAGAAVIPDATDLALAEYLLKHKIVAVGEDGEGDTRGWETIKREMEAREMMIIKMLELQLKAAWVKALELEEEVGDIHTGLDHGMVSESQTAEIKKAAVARGRVRGIAQSLAIMKNAPKKITAQMIIDEEEAWKP